MTKTVSALSGGIVVAALFAFTSIAFADSTAVDFESPTYSLGNINGQDGWSKTGAYDVEIVANSYGIPAFDAQTLRFSNAVTSGSFGDQTFSKSLVDEAGETDAQNGGMSGGTRQNHFEAEFDIASTVGSEQPGLFMSVSPDRGDGARMSYLGFDDETDGIHVIFYDVTNPTHTTNATSFNLSEIATLDRSVPHTVKLTMDFVDGPDNDVVQVYIDGTLIHTGTSWENYYRYDTESNPLLVDESRTVDSLLFRAGGAAAPANAGFGYLIDNLNLSSSSPTTPPTATDQCKNGGWMTFNNPSYENQGQGVAAVTSQSANH